MNDKAIFTFIKKYIFFVSAYSYPINKPTRMLPAHNNTHVSDMHTGSRGRVRSRVMPREKEQKRKKKKEKERERRSFAIIRRYQKYDAHLSKHRQVAGIVCLYLGIPGRRDKPWEYPNAV